MDSGELVFLSKLSALRSYHDKAYAGDQRNGAQDGRNGHGALLVMRDLERSEVNIFLLVRETYAPKGKADNS
jgi:hypothetical protein